MTKIAWEKFHGRWVICRFHLLFLINSINALHKDKLSRIKKLSTISRTIQKTSFRTCKKKKEKRNKTKEMEGQARLGVLNSVSDAVSSGFAISLSEGGVSLLRHRIVLFPARVGRESPGRRIYQARRTTYPFSQVISRCFGRFSNNSIRLRVVERVLPDSPRGVRGGCEARRTARQRPGQGVAAENASDRDGGNRRGLFPDSCWKAQSTRPRDSSMRKRR